MLNCKLRLCLTFFICLILISFVITPSALQRPINTQTGYFELNNGLKVVLYPDNKMQLVSMTVGFQYGAAYDIKGKSGLANLTFQVCSRMITKIFEEQYNRILSNEGALFDPQFNRDVVTFTTVFPKEELDTVLLIEAQRMSLKRIDPLELETVKRLLMSHFMQAKKTSPTEELKFYLRGAINNYWEYYHEYEGTQMDVQVARIQDIERSLTRYYSPDNASIVLRGPINPPQVRTRIEEIFSPVQKSDIKPLTYKSYSTGTKTTRLKYPDSAIDRPALGISFRVPPITHEDFPAVKVLYYLTIANNNSALKTILRRTGVQQDDIFHTLYENGGPGILGIIIIVRNVEDIEPMEMAVKKEILSITKGTFSDQDIRDAIRSAVKDNDITLNEQNYTRNIARWLLMFNKPDEINNYALKYNSLTRVELKRAAENYFIENNMTLVYMVKE